MLLSQSSLLLAILLPFSIAATCDQSNALPWSPSSSSSDTSTASASSPSSTPSSSGATSSFETCFAGCDVTDAGCIVDCLTAACAQHCDGSTTDTCYQACLNDPCAAFWGSGSDEPDEEALNACYQAELGQCSTADCSGSGKMLLRGRATFSCSSSETCYIEDELLFCLDPSTGAYTDETGGRGNVNTGDYTSAESPNAATSTGLTAAAPTDTATAADSPTTTSAGEVEATTSVAGTSPAANGRPATATSATATSTTANAGVEKHRADAMIGVLGLAVGLLV